MILVPVLAAATYIRLDVDDTEFASNAVQASALEAAATGDDVGAPDCCKIVGVEVGPCDGATVTSTHVDNPHFPGHTAAIDGEEQSARLSRHTRLSLTPLQL